MQLLKFLFLIISFFTFLNAQSSHNCPEGQYPKQGTEQCIIGSPQMPPNIWLPGSPCGTGYQVQQGTFTCMPKQEVSFDGPFLPTCTNGRLVQGVTTCDIRYPKADAGGDISAQVGVAITIIGSGTDTDGTIVAYEWKKGNSVLATNASFDYIPIQEGRETLTFTVTDNDGLKATDSIVVTAYLNSPPIADAGVDMTTPVYQTVTILGSGSSSDGTIISYQWLKNGTILANTATVDYTPTVVGTDTLTLTVTDDDGVTDSDSMELTVIAIPTHKGNISVVYDTHTQIAKIKWDETIYQDTDGYRVERQYLITGSSETNGNWTEIGRFLPGSGNYLTQDHTGVASTYRIVSLSDSGLLSGDNDTTQLSVIPQITSNLYFTQNDVNVSMPLNRVVTVNTQVNSSDIEKVIYYMDINKIGESSIKPNFPLSINTATYTNGTHRLDNTLKISDSSYTTFNTSITTSNSNLNLSLSLKRSTGLIPVVAYASSRETINGVKFYLDSVLVADIKDKNYCTNWKWGCEDPNNPYDSYMWEWNSTAYTPNTYTIKAEVSDAGGEYLSKEITHNLNNPPELIVTSPINDSVVGNTLSISGTATDDETDTIVTISIGSQVIYSANGNTFSTTYNMTGLPEKIYTVEIKATDPSNNSTIERKSVLYKAGSNLIPWKTLGYDKQLLKINNDYLLYRKGSNDLNKLKISTDTLTLYDLGKTGSHRYEDVNNNGQVVYYADKYDPTNVSHIYMADSGVTELGTGQHPILNNEYSLWIGRYSSKMHLYSFFTQTLIDIEKPQNSKYWLNWSYYVNNSHFCASVNFSGTNYDMYVYDILNGQLQKITNTSDIVEICKGIDNSRVVFGEYNSSPNKLYYSELNNLNAKTEISSNFQDAKLVDGLIAWVDNDDNSLYVLNKNETIPIKIATNAYLREVKDGVLTYTKDSKLYLYDNGTSREIWPTSDTHYIDNGYIYIIRGIEKLIYRISI